MDNQPELTEEQFMFLKGLCDQRAFIAVLPDFTEDEPEEHKKNHALLTEKFASLVQLGFLENATEKLGEAIAEAKKQTGKGFTAYLVTEQTFTMFHGPEGLVN